MHIEVFGFHHLPFKLLVLHLVLPEILLRVGGRSTQEHGRRNGDECKAAKERTA